MDKFRISIWFLLIPLLSAGYVPFEDCGSVYHLESIDVSGCTDYPCNLEIGTTVQLTVNLLVQGSNINTNDLLQEVYFQVSTILMEVHAAPDLCTAVRGFNHTSCDLAIGERVAYVVNLTVQNVPPLPARLFWTIKSRSTDQVVVCCKMTVMLT